MVRLILIVLFCLPYQRLLSQDLAVYKTPPNTVWLLNNIYIDKTEICNIHWLEYLFYLTQDSAEINVKKAQPDTSVWLSLGDTVRSRHYLTYPGYRYYPVVGISFEQAIRYCNWRSAVVNNKLQQDSSQHNIFYQYRLPTEKEWILAASAELNISEYPFGYKDVVGPSSLKNRKVKTYYNKITIPVELKVFKNDLKNYNKNNEEIVFNVMKSFKDYFYFGDYAPRDSFDARTQPNSLGLYHMIGNVAEMVQEENIAKGGSWFHFPNESMIQHKINYSKPEPWLGFRCVCDVLSNPD